MSRRFGKVIGTVWASNKFRELDDDTSRLAYIYLHTNTHGNCIGAYRLPPAYMAADLKVSEETALRAMARMAEVALIEFDPAETIVRIEDWWPYNPITNRKHLQSAITAVDDLPRRCLFRPRVAFEICEATRTLAKGWATDAKGAAAATDALTMCGKMIRKILSEATDTAIRKAENELSIELLIGLSQDLSIPRERFSFPDRDRDRDADKRLRQETETETDENPPESATAPAARKVIAPDTQRLIETMTAKAAGTRP